MKYMSFTILQNKSIPMEIKNTPKIHKIMITSILLVTKKEIAIGTEPPKKNMKGTILKIHPVDI